MPRTYIFYKQIYLHRTRTPSKISCVTGVVNLLKLNLSYFLRGSYIITFSKTRPLNYGNWLFNVIRFSDCKINHAGYCQIVGITYALRPWVKNRNYVWCMMYTSMAASFFFNNFSEIMLPRNLYAVFVCNRDINKIKAGDIDVYIPFHAEYGGRNYCYGAPHSSFNFERPIPLI